MRKKKAAIEAAYAEARQDRSVVMQLEDEAGFYRQPTAAGVWAVRGRTQPKMHWSQKGNTCVRVAATLDPVSGGVVHRLASAFSVGQMGRFYRLVSQAHPKARKIYLVMDNWPVHAHPKAWEAIQADERIKVLWLPTYAPWLNPIEKLWKWVRQLLTHMHPWADDWPLLRQNIDRLLNLANEQPLEILLYTGTGNYTLYSS